MASALIGAAFSVLLKALSPVMDPVLEAWAASKNLDRKVLDLKMELLCVKAVLEGNLDMEIHNAALEELLQNLHDLVYDAEDVLDELDYFRIQDELDGTFDAVDKHPKGCAHNLVFNTTHTAKAIGKLIWPPASCSSAAAAPGASRRRRRAHGSISSPAHTNQLANEGEVHGCNSKLASGPSNTIRAVGKCLPCSSLPPVHSDDDDNSDGGSNEHAKEMTKLEFNRVEVSKRIGDILEKLQPMSQRICMLLGPLRPNQRSTVLDRTQSRLATTSKSIEPKLYGRDPVIKSIIHDITQGKYSGEDLTVLPIVGPGGMGKTALAQHIYHSQELLGHFDVKVWICVSLKFNVDKLIEGIEKQIPKVDNENTGTAAELIEQRLKTKRFLLVLDDMWECSNKDEWKRLLLPLKSSQKKGNTILVTTRRPAVAGTVVTKTDYSIELGGLAYEEFKELFLAFVFDDEQSRMDHPELVETGDKIMEKLKGSPLAAKTVCTLLGKHLDFNHWKRVLESQEWKEQKNKNDIMPALKLSYDYLPFYLQPCFSYCALFPQDYRFGREKLIHLWIGLDVLHLHGENNKRIEDIGLSHLEELVDHGFLKNEEKDGKTYYVLHDLLHELALKVSSRECLSIYSYSVGSIQVPPSVRHLSINIDDTSVKDKQTFDSCTRDLKKLDKRLKVENLHTLMLFGEHHGSFVKTFANLFQEAKFIRVLFLSGASYNMEDLLPNFLKLIHLRYLRIRSNYYFSKIEVPSNIPILYHLKVLDLQRCNIKNVLPRDITNLIKLRHLLVRNNEMHSSIFEVGKLKWLQELRRFVVKKETPGFELRQIGDLEELCGSLLIDNLEKVEVKEEAAEAKLTQKGRLHELKLCWDTDRSTKDLAQDDQVLENLKPNTNLLKLSIKGHGGTTCPSWLGQDLSIKNLESLRLDGVAWSSFPPIGELCLVNGPHEEISNNFCDKKFQKLRRLELVKLPRLKKWVVHAPCQLFAHLEVLIIKDCCNLSELSFAHSTCCRQDKEKEANMKWFPNLRELEIEKCLELLSFPPIPWTSTPCSAKLSEVASGLDNLDCRKIYQSECSLAIEGRNNLDSTFWNVLAFDNLSELKELDIWSCPPLPLHHFHMLSSLKTLKLWSSSSIVFPLVEGESYAEYQFPVECMTIGDWGASAKELTQLLAYFSNLSELTLWYCDKILGLGVAEKHAKTTPVPPSSAVKEDGAQTEKHQQQDGTRGEDEIAAEELLLLPPQLQKLVIDNCPEMSLRSSPVDHNREAGRTAGGQGLQGLTSLRQLKIVCCPRFLSSYLSSSSSPCFPFPDSLEDLSLWGAVGAATPLPLSNLTSLTDLYIVRCGDLRGEGLRTLLAQGRLAQLTVRRSPNFLAGSEPSPQHEQGLTSSSSKLKQLVTDDVAGLLAAPIWALLSSSLTELHFYNSVERFTKEQEEALLLLTSLERIGFWDCDKLQCLPAGLHRLPNLKRLDINSCAAIRSLPKDGLPSSLRELEIKHCPAIRSLPKECLPSSLLKLVIGYCPAIRSLPKVDDLPSSLRELKVDDLPSSLRELNVRDRNSEELRRHCRKLIGTIPIVRA